MSLPILLRHSGTAGNTPASLAAGELALNYRDGLLFWSDASSVVQQFPLKPSGVVVYAATSAFPATGATGLLYVSEQTNRLFRWSATDSVYVEVGTVQGATTAPPQPTPIVAALIAG